MATRSRYSRILFNHTKNEILPLATTGMDSEGIVLSEIKFNDVNMTNYEATSGGAIYSEAGKVYLNYTQMSNGKVSDKGGAIYFNSWSWDEDTQTHHTTDATQDFKVYKSAITNNDAGDRGGAIYYSAAGTIFNSNFTNNTAGVSNDIYRYNSQLKNKTNDIR